jgi:parallel beta-helix repeat protein
MNSFKVFTVFSFCIINSLFNASESYWKMRSGNQEMPFSIKSILPLNYVKDGSYDYTDYVQQALNKYNNITFPGFPILINDKGLYLKSNSRITFMPGSRLILKPTSKNNYSILQMRNVSNVTLINPVIIGDRAMHLGTEGEWGMGISIYSSSNITITGANVSNCWGDGIYISRVKNGSSPIMVHISNSSLSFNRRDGISIISVDGLLLDSIYSANCNGTLPMSGINFEPESYKDDLLNIEVRNVKTENNPGNGMQIGLKKLYGGSNKKIDIKIINHTDISSNIAFKISDNISRRVNNESISGTILIQNPDWKNNALSPIQTSIFDNQLKLKIVSPIIQTSADKKLTQSQIKKLLLSKACINKEASYNLLFK